MAADFVNVERGVRGVDVDLAVYSLDAVLKVAYWFTDRCYLHIQSTGPKNIQIRFKPRRDTDSNDLPEQFLNDLLDQTLRERLAQETEAFKNLILAHALSKTCLIHTERETMDPVDDPLRISLNRNESDAPI